jgi:hypothetical protein
VTRLDWRGAYHIIPSRYPVVGIFDDVAAPDDLEIAIALAAATNPRILEQAGDLRLVRDKDRISGPGATPIMAAFTHAKPSRFSDGSFGVYYAAKDEETAIAETAFHRARFLRNAHLPDERLDMRVYQVDLCGRYDDLRRAPLSDPRYDPDPLRYAAAQQYARALYQADKVDGIAFKSVRRRAGNCAAVFRPACLSNCMVAHHLEYRFSAYELTGVFRLSPMPG